MLIRFLARVALPMLVLQACAPKMDAGNDFDETKISEIHVGATSKTQIQALFGTPMNRMNLDGKETWTYQRVTTSDGGAGGKAVAASGAMTVATMAGYMIPGVGALGAFAGMAAQAGATRSMGDSTITSNSKGLTIEFRQDVVASCRLTTTKVSASAATAMGTGSDVEITTCGGAPSSG
jgi:outer membrane protein assembly factor BamE (lipoprotein component of BamABCDE complex)